MQKNGVKPGAALHLLASQRDTTAAELAKFTPPCLVLCGLDDHDNGDAAALAQMIPAARLVRTPGDHLSASGKAEFRNALTAFLKEDLL
jgi:pimeloyl-ACP methyl ester carboxylesterase